MSIPKYKFEQTEDKRWGIYMKGRLLATVGSYEACESIEQSLSRNASYTQLKKAAISYKKSINRSLIIG